MIVLDGSQRSGSGTIVRSAVTLAGLLGRDLRVTNVRAKRSHPGLQPQHVRAVEAVAQVMAAFADQPSHFEIHGGLFQDFAPSAFQLEHALLRLLARAWI